MAHSLGATAPVDPGPTSDRPLSMPIPGRSAQRGGGPAFRALSGAFVVWTVLLAPSAAIGQERGREAPGGDRGSAVFTLDCDGGCPPASVHLALEAALAARDEGAALLGVSPRVPGTPLSINLYRDPRAFEAAEERLVGGGLRRNRSFAHAPTRSAHISLQEGIPDLLLVRYGPTPRTLRLVAHEAFHLVTYESLPGAVHLPGWLLEGAAAWVEQRVGERMGWSPGLTDDPVPSTYLWMARRSLHRGTLPSIRELLLHEEHGAGHVEDYALPMLLVSHLRNSRPADLDELFQLAARLDPGDPAAPVAVEHAIHRALGGPEFTALDRSFRSYLASLRPSWVEVSRALETGGWSWVQVGLEGEALAWRLPGESGAEGRRLTLEGVAELLSPRSTLRVALEEEGGGRVDVVLGRGGRVEVARRGLATPDAEREPLAAGAPRATTLESSIPFRVAMQEGGIRVEVAGETVIVLPEGTVRATGTWGLVASSGSVGVWHNLRVHRPLAADLAGGRPAPSATR